MFEKLLSDPSYAVIKASASGLGETKSPGAYEALAKLLNVPSWRDNIRASALSGLEALQDKRALDFGFRYTEKENTPAVRAAAIRLIGRIGHDNPKAFTLLAEIAMKAFSTGDYNLATAAGDALVSLTDPRGLSVLEQINRDASVTPRLKERLREYEQQLRMVVAAAHGAK